jgi:hypothetical protein
MKNCETNDAPGISRLLRLGFATAAVRPMTAPLAHI